MAHFVRGAANAYQNQLNWQAKHRRDIDAADTSLFGMGTIIPHIQNGWNHLMFVPAIAKGFIFGEELQPVPTVEIPENLRETDWGKDMVRYQQTEQQINKLRVDAVEHQVMGVLTLNVGRFNEGRATNEAIDHAQEKLNAVILPLKGKEQGQEVQTPNLTLPNVPQDIQKALTYSTAK
jgi:hypothetical protein